MLLLISASASLLYCSYKKKKMANLHSFLFALVLLLLPFSSSSTALNCQPNQSKFARTITVDQSGNGDFTSVQSAIDSIPEMNTQWIHIQISPGKYREKVTIPVKKPCIFLEGAGIRLTSIEWGDHEATSTSATFTSYPDNIVAKGITFKNTYNLDITKINWWGEKIIWRQAVSARIKGEQCAFYKCAFLGTQDTLWDEKGRHYFSNCYIEGAIDFIFGKAQSIYEGCVISVNIGKYPPGLQGCITAQKKEWPQHSSGFVFKNCVVSGTGKAFLGRAWGPYSTVIFYNSTLSDVIVSEGWNAWNYVHHEANFTYAEANNRGVGADTSKRVPWEKKLNADQLRRFLDLSFVDGGGWLAKIPKLH
ncbi:probable pectinesterase 55 [Ricinus communis]|uniref:probable pectinesterase 55 n=1 Tax=Ricinus communis TaxID=3988 RepID=UPI000D697793|nr:probable pectinesterase 55 [Ricinus communis]|eukprot:XP_015572328.2 probable pectinesterase 55 [Ricinus communis]